MITVGEAQVLIGRLAASNIALRSFIVNTPDDAMLKEAARVWEENRKALADFAATHPETLSSADPVSGIV